MPKYCKTCKKQGHNDNECWIIHPDLHIKFKEDGDDHGNENTGTIVMQGDVVGMVAASTNVLTSDKVLGKPVPNTTKNEWMQRSKNKHHRDNKGYIIDNDGNLATETTQEHEEMKGKETTGKNGVTGKQQSKVPVQISIKFALLEEGEIDVPIK